MHVCKVQSSLNWFSYTAGSKCALCHALQQHQTSVVLPPVSGSTSIFWSSSSCCCCCCCCSWSLSSSSSCRKMSLASIPCLPTVWWFWLHTEIQIRKHGRLYYSGTLLNGHPSTVDTHNMRQFWKSRLSSHSFQYLTNPWEIVLHE